MELLKTYRMHALRLALLLGVLFALAPCTVKSSMYSTVGVAFSSPINKTKSAVQNSCAIQTAAIVPCAVSQDAGQLIVPEIPVEALAISNATAVNTPQDNENLLVQISSPPLYILYKRMKSDMAAV